MRVSIPPLPQQPPLMYHESSLPIRVIFPHVAAVSASFSILLVLSLCLRKIRRQRSNPADSKPPHQYSYSILRRATSSFSASRRLGQGGFGSVYRATIPNQHDGNHNNNNGNQTVAVKVMDAGSLQVEREFQNELFFASKLDSSLVVSVHGFSYDRKRRRMLLVYELMPNGNLQDALLRRKCPELMNWKQRFSIAVDIAKGLDYLHGLDPPIIHGDIKPSNVLLDQNFSAKIADFGLARLKSEDIRVEIAEDYGSVAETESVATGIDEFSLAVDQSPVSVTVTDSPLNAEAVTVAASPAPLVVSPEMMEKGSVSEGNLSVLESGGKRIKSSSGSDWCRKQDNVAAPVESGKVKDYVMQWIGTEIKERPNSDWIASVASSSSLTNAKSEKKKKGSRKRLEWWVSMEDDKGKNVKKEKRRPAREWWKEEYCEELTKKKKKKRRQQGMYDSKCNGGGGGNWWPVDDELYTERKKGSKRNKSKVSVGSVDWLWEGLSGELRRSRRNGYDSFSGEIPKSGGASSTPSMRGTVCYVAPEYGGGGDVSEKCDVYSFGVVMLVLIAGRRPLQVTGSPMSEFQRANLISWARRLARTGKLIELVDQNIQSLNREQALLCITVALLCLQKLPHRRPSMKEVVGMLTGEAELPQLPTELSPSPPSRYPFKSRKKVR
ncbi:Receptor-like serine/threonine-protein kinase [Hibiscus syriacus]|uniref:Receptor-like serine/threonine-protein kinase n=1 Tax=Hibiscus syriacus TaxID=106335 RepID=A0A6A3D941_HIBSY|nr:receptor-like serine/threonine-protein kinase At4g25390 [Hibiscus syriacus]KAE8736468.1 Receptor-like serine/threonine-protein kinase [Hibiscus syriacus]